MFDIFLKSNCLFLDSFEHIKYYDQSTNSIDNIKEKTYFKNQIIKYVIKNEKELKHKPLLNLH